MDNSLSNVINYCKIVNGSKGFNNTKTQLLSEMTQDYNIGRENTIYRFDIVVNTVDGKDVYINNSDTPIRGVVDVKRQQTADTEMQETIQVYPNQIKRGDYLRFKVNDTDELRDYIITSKIEKKHGYDEGIFKECNHLLKWMYKGELYDSLGTTYNATKYTEGTKEISAGISEIYARYTSTVQDNKKNRTIKIGTRFIINGVAWEVTQTDFTTNKGLITLTMGKSSIIQGVDDIELEIADYKTVKHDYKFDIPTNFNVTKDDNVKLVYSIQDNLKDIDYNLVEIEYSGGLIQVAKDGKDITIIGKELGTGNIKLKVNLTNETKEFNINFNVVQAIVNEVKYNVTTSNNYTYRPKEGATLTGYKYINGTPDSTLIIDYSLDSSGQSLLNRNAISIIKKSNNELQIRNININVLTTFMITIIDKATGSKILDNQIITLKGV